MNRMVVLLLLLIKARPRYQSVIRTGGLCGDEMGSIPSRTGGRKIDNRLKLFLLQFQQFSLKELPLGPLSAQG